MEEKIKRKENKDIIEMMKTIMMIMIRIITTLIVTGITKCIFRILEITADDFFKYCR